eukprot:2122910-Amphidinium_carterae.1
MASLLAAYDDSDCEVATCRRSTSVKQSFEERRRMSYENWFGPMAQQRIVRVAQQRIVCTCLTVVSPIGESKFRSLHQDEDAVQAIAITDRNMIDCT